MNCKYCGNNFCFVCLQSQIKMNDGSLKWQCSKQGHSQDCGVAPIQVLI